MDIKRAKKMAVHLGAEVMIAETKNGKLIFHVTKGFAHFWKPE